MYVPLVRVVLCSVVRQVSRQVGGGYCIVGHAAEDLYDVIPPHHQQPIRRAGERRGGVQTYTTCTRAVGRCIFIKICINRAVLYQFQPFLRRSFTLISLKEQTAQSEILSVRSERSALCLKERHRSQNEGSLKSEERLSDFKERYAQLW